mmetsp:Transcript_10672/g.17423  ORF Transcript_10672/g.17423 Transcript_10672/m.17423 type:complete len:194 (+) Transcript_10672:2426-3007(+)
MAQVRIEEMDAGIVRVRVCGYEPGDGGLPGGISGGLIAAGVLAGVAAINGTYYGLIDTGMDGFVGQGTIEGLHKFAGMVLVVMLLVRYGQRNRVVEESVLIIPKLGIQLETNMSNGAQVKQFYSNTCIQNLVFNEAITWCRVICYLALIVSSEDKMVRLFPHFQPTSGQLENIFRRIDPFPHNNHLASKRKNL